jgi:hypothetical protein
LFENLLEDQLIQCHVIGDYKKMLHYMEKLEKNTQKKEFYDRQFKDKNKNIRKSSGFLCCKSYGPYLRDFYAQKPVIIKRQIEVEKKKKEKMNFGIAFITVY